MTRRVNAGGDPTVGLYLGVAVSYEQGTLVTNPLNRLMTRRVNAGGELQDIDIHHGSSLNRERSDRVCC
jgi:hypothetical protein